MAGFCESPVDIAGVQGNFRGFYGCVNLIPIFRYGLKSQ